MNEPLRVTYDALSMVMTVALNRPTRGNALSPALVEALLALVRGVSETFGERILGHAAVPTALGHARQPLVRVFVITGVGKLFCAGMDLKAASESAPTSNSTTANTIALFEAVRNLPMPSVLLLNGAALGGGTVFAFLVDFVLAVHDAYLQFTEVKIGLLPAMISCFIVPRVGSAQASAMMLSGRRYAVHELLRTCPGGIPIVSCDASDAAQLQQRGTQFIHEHLLTSSTLASAHLKRLVRHICTHTHEENCDEAQRVFATVFASDDMQRGLAAFASRQKADWAEQVKSRL